MFDMMGMMGKMNEMKTRMKQAQDELETLTQTANIDGVRVVVNGKKQLLTLEIAPELQNQSSTILQESIIVATNKALNEIDIQITNRMQQATEGLMPNIPGLGGLSNLFN